MSTQENNKPNVEQECEASPEDLQVQGDVADSVKGGPGGFWQYRVASTGETFNS